jgi:hypothetical protein
MFFKLWRRIEAGGINYIADQFAANKDHLVAEVHTAVGAGEATLAEVNRTLEQHVGIALRPILDGLLQEAEAAAEAEVGTVDVGAYIDKVVAALHAEAAKLLAEAQ